MPMYNIVTNPSYYTHSIRIEQLPRRFRELVVDWTWNLHAEERLNYLNGEFYMVVPFQMLDVDSSTVEQLVIFTRRFNRLCETNNEEALQQHVASYPYAGWRVHGEELANYLEMMFMLHHLVEKLPKEYIRPNTLAIYVHD